MELIFNAKESLSGKQREGEMKGEWYVSQQKNRLPCGRRAARHQPTRPFYERSALGRGRPQILRGEENDDFGGRRV